MPIASMCFALFVANNASCKNVACLVLYSRKLFLITLPLLFKKRVENSSHFVNVIRTSHGIALTITKLIDFYSQGIFTFFCLPPFSIEMNQNINS